MWGVHCTCMARCVRNPSEVGGQQMGRRQLWRPGVVALDVQCCLSTCEAAGCWQGAGTVCRSTSQNLSCLADGLPAQIFPRWIAFVPCPSSCTHSSSAQGAPLPCICVGMDHLRTLCALPCTSFGSSVDIKNGSHAAFQSANRQQWSCQKHTMSCSREQRCATQHQPMRLAAMREAFLAESTSVQ